MANTGKNFKKMLVLLAFGLTYGFMYILPYMKYTFYDQMIAAMQCTNEQLGSLMTMYAIACTLSYLPGGWVADKFKCKNVLVWSSIVNGILCFVFMFTYKSYRAAQIIWFLCAFTGGFAFWPALLKGIRLLGNKEEQGRLYGIFEALNGVSALIVSFLMIGVLAVFADNLLLGFKGAVGTMGALCVLAGIVLFFLYDENLTTKEDESEKESDNIDLKQFIEVFKMPVVWLVAFMMFGQVFFAAGMSYLTPYSTGVFGIGASIAAIIGTLRLYGARFVGGPAGGYLSDKTFKSASKGQVFFFALCGILMALFLVLPAGTNTTLIAILLVGVGVAFYMEKGPLYAVLPELKVPRKVTGTAIAFVTLIGYLPDMFAHKIFGKWLDLYGDAAYQRIFGFSAGIAIACVVLSLICVVLVKKYMNEESKCQTNLEV